MIHVHVYITLTGKKVLEGTLAPFINRAELYKNIFEQIKKYMARVEMFMLF